MINIEEQLNKLPKGRLSKRADWRLRFTFFKLKWQNNFANHNFLSAFGKMVPVAIAVILLLSLVCLPYYAYASENVVRGNLLYPIKQGIEKLELSLADTPTKKIEVFAKLAERRLAEVEKLSNENSVTANDNLAATIDEITALTLETNSEAENKLNPDQKKQVDDRMAQIKEKQLEKMEKIANKFGLQASDNLLDSLAVNIDDLKKDAQVKNDFSRVLSEIKISTSTKNFRALSHVVNNITGSTTIATSTKITAKQGRTSIKIDQKIISESWSNASERIDALKDKLINEGAGEAEYNDLFNKLDDRLKKAQAAINSVNFNQADGLIKSTEALSNNAKHFLRFGNMATSTIWQATSSTEQTASSTNSWRNEMEKKIKNFRNRSNNR